MRTRVDDTAGGVKVVQRDQQLTCKVAHDGQWDTVVVIQADQREEVVAHDLLEGGAAATIVRESRYCKEGSGSQRRQFHVPRRDQQVTHAPRRPCIRGGRAGRRGQMSPAAARSTWNRKGRAPESAMIQECDNEQQHRCVHR